MLDLSKMLKTKDVAKIFGISCNTVRVWIGKGILPVAYISPSGKNYFSKEDVYELLEKGSVQRKEKVSDEKDD